MINLCITDIDMREIDCGCRLREWHPLRETDAYKEYVIEGTLTHVREYG